jgi:branched-chain amino acid transport system ATP-binding protein
MEIIARYVTRILAFYSGEVIADGLPRDVLSNTKVQEFVIGHHLDLKEIA